MGARVGVYGVGLALACTLSMGAKPESGVYFRVDGLKSAKGLLRCGAFTDEENWLGDHPHASAQAKISKGRATCVFPSLKAGVYALTALHDADGDGKMSKSALGLPEEGYAASRRAAREGIARPDWSDAKFRYDGGVMRLHARILYP